LTRTRVAAATNGTDPLLRMGKPLSYEGQYPATAATVGRRYDVLVSIGAIVRRRPSRRVATAMLALAFALTACSSGTQGHGVSTDPTAPPTSPRPTTSTDTPPATGSTGPSPATQGEPVHVSLLEGDGGVYGIGMPIIAYVDRKITDAAAFEKAAAVTVNGKPVDGAWYWQRSGRKGQVYEAHYRTRTYWPANAKILLNLPVKGLSAGRGLAYDDSLTLSISTGAAHVSTVDCRAERMRVTSGGRLVRTLPTSCGAANTPTYTGTKIVMQKGENVPGSGKFRQQGAVRMVSNEPGNAYDLLVPWSLRLTNSGEYAHAASWNGGNIGVRSTSHGCTNLNVAAAEWFYTFSRVGDVLTYANTGGPRMPTWDGYGDWNLPWTVWQAGGIV
jgi:lipoprotein-anchoring transpeptidase ErfK/SrfK